MSKDTKWRWHHPRLLSARAVLVIGLYTSMDGLDVGRKAQKKKGKKGRKCEKWSSPGRLKIDWSQSAVLQSVSGYTGQSNRPHRACLFLVCMYKGGASPMLFPYF